MRAISAVRALRSVRFQLCRQISMLNPMLSGRKRLPFFKTLRKNGIKCNNGLAMKPWSESEIAVWYISFCCIFRYSNVQNASGILFEYFWFRNK